MISAAGSAVHLVRHGEVYNPDGIIYGRLPGYRLSAAGEEMARKAAAWLAGRDIALVRSSPLERAVQTATAIADVLDLTVETDERLLESGSAFEGHRIRSAGDVLRSGLLPRLWNPRRPSWGEPYTEIAARMLAAADAARRDSGGREAVCVSHQQPIWIARRAAEGKSLPHRPDRRECALASVTTFRYDAAGRIVGTGYAEPAGSAGRRTGQPPVTPP
jgi:broad specificity phosphatase PhoE